MPMDVRTVAAAGEVHANPFVGPIDHTVAIRVDVSALDANLVDANGYLKPGVPLQRTGIPIGISPAFVFGCVVEAVKVADNNTTALATAADVDVAVAVVGAVNRAILEDNLGRALTADELAGFDRAGSKIALLF